MKTKQKLVKMSCTAYIVYKLHLSLHYANFGQFQAKQVLLKICFVIFFSCFVPFTLLEKTEKKTCLEVGPLGENTKKKVFFMFVCPKKGVGGKSPDPL